MIKIDYPQHNFRVKEEQGKKMIFDELRKSWLILTPEEWVRQNFVRFLLSRNIPSALIAVEKKIMLGELSKRFDIVVFDNAHQPWMIVECKAMSVPLSEQVLHQVLRYHIAIPAVYVAITNGVQSAVYGKEGGRLIELHEFPTGIFPVQHNS